MINIDKIKQNKVLIVSILVVIIIAITTLLLLNKKVITIPNNTKVEIKEINFTDNVINLKVNEEYNMQIDYVPTNYIQEDIVYVVNDDSVLSIDSNGLIKALKTGNAIVSAITKSGKTTNAEVVVEDDSVVFTKSFVPISNIEINESKINLTSGQTYQIKYTIEPNNATDKTIMWETTDARIATVTDTGLISARQAGNVVLTAYSINGKQKSISLTVSSVAVNLSSIELNPSELVLNLGETYQIKSTYIPSNAKVNEVNWTSSNENVVTVDKGLVKAIGYGTSNITLNADGIEKEVIVTVSKDDIIDITSLSLTESTLIMKANTTHQLKANITPTDATNTNLVWSSSDSSIATINNKGLITAIKSGTTTITIKSTNNKTSTLKLTVENSASSNNPEQVLLNSDSIVIGVGNTKQLRATIIPLDANQTVTWYSGDPNVVEVSNTGLIKTKKSGKTTISALTSNGLVAKCTVIVRYPDITIETRATKGAPGSSISKEEVDLINDHLANYVNEMGEIARINGQNVLRAKTLAAAFFLAYNPYYKVEYNFVGKDSIGKGWFTKWGNYTNDPKYVIKGIDCNAFIRWSFYQVLNKDIGSIGTSMRARDDQGLTVGAIAAVAEPGDVLRKSQELMGGTSGHVAFVYSVDRANGTISVIHAAGLRLGVTITTYSRSSSRTNFNFLYDMNYIYGS